MTQVNISTKQKKAHRHKEQAGGCQVGGGAGLEWGSLCARGSPSLMGEETHSLTVEFTV